MSVRILHDPDEHKAVLYDSTTDVAFGETFSDCEQGCCLDALMEYTRRAARGDA